MPAGRLEKNKVARRYAKALFEIVSETTSDKAPRQMTAVLDNLMDLKTLCTDKPEFLRFFQNPSVKAEAKQGFLTEHLEATVKPVVYNLLSILLQNSRLDTLPAIAEAFEALYHQANRIAKAEVVTAIALNAEQEAAFEKTLSKTFGLKKVVLSQTVAPEILGGVILKIQDQIIDGSYAGRLAQLQQAL